MKFLEEDLFLVTGASSGIGREIALKLNELGARVIATGRDTKRLMETQQLAKLQTKIYTEAYDLTENIEEIPNFIKTLKEKYGKFKGLICAAGVDITQTTQMINLKDMEKIFKINYQAPMFLAKAFCDKRNNIGESASLLFIASIAGVFPDKGQSCFDSFNEIDK
jgi:short-subunit dehydrogenase